MGAKHFVYTFVSNEALASVRRKVKALSGRSTCNLDLAELLWALNPILRRWAAYFRYAAAKRAFGYLGWYGWWWVMRRLRKKHPRLTWKQLQRRFFGKDRLQAEGVVLYSPAAMRVLRYRFRGGQITTPWNDAKVDPSGGRFRRTDHDDPWFLEDVQRALT